MKIFIPILLLIASFEGCKLPSQKNYGSLTIVLDSTLNNDLLDFATLTCSKFSSSPNGMNYTNTAQMYHWDSLIFRDYQFNIHSIFSKVQKVKIAFTQNSNFYINNVFDIQKVNRIEEYEFADADTIEFVYLSERCVNACYFAIWEKSILTKSDSGKYKIQSKITTDPEVRGEGRLNCTISDTIIHKLFMLQTEAQNQSENVTIRDLMNLTRDKNRLFILVNKKFLVFDDYKVDTQKLYLNLRKCYVKSNDYQRFK